MNISNNRFFQSLNAVKTIFKNIQSFVLPYIFLQAIARIILLVYVYQKTNASPSFLALFPVALAWGALNDFWTIAHFFLIFFILISSMPSFGQGGRLAKASVFCASYILSSFLILATVASVWYYGKNGSFVSSNLIGNIVQCVDEIYNVSLSQNQALKAIVVMVFALVSILGGGCIFSGFLQNISIFKNDKGQAMTFACVAFVGLLFFDSYFAASNSLLTMSKSGALAYNKNLTNVSSNNIIGMFRIKGHVNSNYLSSYINFGRNTELYVNSLRGACENDQDIFISKESLGSSPNERYSVNNQVEPRNVIIFLVNDNFNSFFDQQNSNFIGHMARANSSLNDISYYSYAYAVNSSYLSNITALLSGSMPRVNGGRPVTSLANLLKSAGKDAIMYVDRSLSSAEELAISKSGFTVIKSKDIQDGGNFFKTLGKAANDSNLSNYVYIVDSCSSFGNRGCDEDWVGNVLKIINKTSSNTDFIFVGAKGRPNTSNIAISFQSSKVPLVIARKRPGSGKKQLINSKVSIIDIPSTVLKIVNYGEANNLPGINLLNQQEVKFHSRFFVQRDNICICYFDNALVLLSPSKKAEIFAINPKEDKLLDNDQINDLSKIHVAKIIGKKIQQPNQMAKYLLCSNCKTVHKVEIGKESYFGDPFYDSYPRIPLEKYNEQYLREYLSFLKCAAVYQCSSS